MKRLFLFVAIFFLNMILVGAMSHPASGFGIKIDSVDINLESAIAGKTLTGRVYYMDPTSIVDPGHSAGEIWISTDSGEMTLLDALINEIPLERDSFTSYMTVPIKGHLATEVTVSVLGKNLQQAINDGDFPSCVSNYGNSCGGSCFSGTIDCDGSCVGGNAARGTSCGTNKACDGSGNCYGWSGTGCSNCPNGWYTMATTRYCAYYGCNVNGAYGKLAASGDSVSPSTGEPLCNLWCGGNMPYSWNQWPA